MNAVRPTSGLLAFPLALAQPCKVCLAPPAFNGTWVEPPAESVGSPVELRLHTEHRHWCVAKATRDVDLATWVLPHHPNAA